MLAVIVCSNTVVNTARRQYQFDTSVSALNPIPRLRVKVMRPTENETLQFMVDDAIEREEVNATVLVSMDLKRPLQQQSG